MQVGDLVQKERQFYLETVGSALMKNKCFWQEWKMENFANSLQAWSLLFYLFLLYSFDQEC